MRFTVTVHHEDDGSYWSEVKELPGCFASGFSLEEVQEATFDAMQLWLPEGIRLGEPTWQRINEPPKNGQGSATTKKRAPRRRQKLLVCA